MSDYPVLAIDGNWYLHRAFSTIPEEHRTAESIGFRFLGMVCKDAVATRSQGLIVAFDGSSIFRFKLFKYYKSNRTKKKKDKDNFGGEDLSNNDVYQYLQDVMQYVVDSGIAVVQIPEYEADDVLAAIASSPKIKTRVLLGTRDKDSYQLLHDPRVSLYVSDTKPEPTYITGKDVVSKMKLKPEQMVDYQTMVGDPGDGVSPASPHMTPGRALTILKSYGDLGTYYEQAKGKERKELVQYRERFRRNYDLVKLVTDCYEVDLKLLKPKKCDLKNDEYKNLPKSWFRLQEVLYPKTKGLF